MKIFYFLLLLLSSIAVASNSENEFSVYQLELQLETQNGKFIEFKKFQGEPLIIGMFYANCPHVCPLTIHNIQKAENILSKNQRNKLRVLMISLDPEKDTPALLQSVVNRQKIDTKRLTLARIPQADVRKLAAVLGVRYRQLEDGEINHTSQVSLIDGNGILVTQSDALSGIEGTMIENMISLLK